jgi:hypothetical protein
MIFDGIKTRRSNAYGWRYAKEGEVGQDGNPLKEGHDVVIVRIADCEQYTDDRGRRRYSPATAPAAVVLKWENYGKSHNVYNCPYGKWAKDENGTKVVAYNYSYTDYWVVYDNRVYKGRCGYKIIAPKFENAA